jgi:hypothetical protein
MDRTKGLQDRRMEKFCDVLSRRWKARELSAQEAGEILGCSERWPFEQGYWSPAWCREDLQHSAYAPREGLHPSYQGAEKLPIFGKAAGPEAL